MESRQERRVRLQEQFGLPDEFADDVFTLADSGLKLEPCPDEVFKGMVEASMRGLGEGARGIAEEKARKRAEFWKRVRLFFGL